MDIFLETDRLTLRRLTMEDADNIYEMDSDPEVTRFINGGQATDFEVIRDQWLPGLLAMYHAHDGYGFFAAIEKATGSFIGWFHLKPRSGDFNELELGYRLRRDAWGKGYATEGSVALIARGFADPRVNRVSAHTLAVNTRSARVMEKAGLKLARKFAYEGTSGWHIGMEAVEYALSRIDLTATP